MSDISFPPAYSGVDWSQSVEVINDKTNKPLEGELETALIELVVNDDCNRPVLRASSVDGSITVPEPGLIQWYFSKEQMASLCTGKTYAVGCRVTPLGGGTSALFVGSLPFLDGEF